MNSQHWKHYFEQNRQHRPEPEWLEPARETESRAKALAYSLSHFQLGESGEGRYLIQQGWKYAVTHDDPAYAQALELFIQEEQEHARLLALLVRRFGGQLTQHHWTHSLFRLVRRAFGLHFELQVLVIAELVGTAYYRLLHEKTTDPVLQTCCALILKDEAKHIEFHIYRLGRWLEEQLPLERAIWTAQFQLLFLGALQVAWMDHRTALQAVNAAHEDFNQEARRECIQFLARLSPSVPSAILSPL